MRRTDRDIIRSLPLFRDVTDSHFDELVAAAFLQRFPRHVVLIREDQLPDFLHIVVEGAVELFANYEGRETAIDVVRPVTTFILAAVICDEIYLQSARTISTAQILMIPAPTVRSVFGRDAGFARAIVTELALRYRGVVRSLKSQKLRAGPERLASWILQADERNGLSGHIPMPYEKRLLAALLGMTPENLSRNLAALSEHGVTREGRFIVVDNRDRLERLTHQSPLIDDP